jgi:hypothetical protein
MVARSMISFLLELWLERKIKVLKQLVGLGQFAAFKAVFNSPFPAIISLLLDNRI